MKRGILLFSISLAIIIRVLLVLQQPALSYDAYHTLLEVTHIQDTGLPMQYDSLGWQGSFDTQLPAFYYILAILSLFFPIELVALVLPNLFMSLLCVPVYLFTKELTRNKHIQNTITLASVFVPLLYTNTLTADPLSLAIPLLFLSFYYFVRLGKTPKDQYYFVLFAALLFVTHPISLLLALAMLFTLLFTTIQRLRFRKPLAEATLFTVFISLWVILLIYKKPLQTFGWEMPFTFPLVFPVFGEVITQIGVLALLFGSYAAYTYLMEETDLTGHALVGLALATILFSLSGTISALVATLLLGITLLILSSGTLQAIVHAKNRSRLPIAYNLSYVLLFVIFLATSAIPALTFGVAELLHTPTPAEQETALQLSEQAPKGSVVLWDKKLGYYLQYLGYQTVWNANRFAIAEQEEIESSLQELSLVRGQIPYIRLLEKNNVDVIISPSPTAPITDRCFTKLTLPLEAYKVRCAVQ